MFDDDDPGGGDAEFGVPAAVPRARGPAEIAELGREEARVAGRKLRAIAEYVAAMAAGAIASGEDEREAVVSAQAEIGLALGITPASASFWVQLARDLVARLPAVLAALEKGTITLAKARVLLAETWVLSAAQLAALEPELLEKSVGRTPSALRAAVRRAVLRVDTAAALARREQARAERGVRLQPEPDAMATLVARLPAEQAVAVYGVIDTLAHAAATPGDPRGIDARRADALVDLILHPGTQPRGRYVVRVDRAAADSGAAAGSPASGEGPAFLRGYGTVPAQVAHELDAHPDRYVPAARLAAEVRERDQHCRFPGCRLPADMCQLDHVVAFRVGGQTVLTNLAALCRHHHRIKHLPGWDLQLDPDGTATWTTPHGQIYRTRPPTATSDEPPELTPLPPPDVGEEPSDDGGATDG